MNLPLIGTGGGPIFWTIVFSGVVAVLLFISRWFALRRAKIDYADFIAGVTNVLSKGNEGEALAICDDNPGAVSSIVAAAILSPVIVPDRISFAVIVAAAICSAVTDRATSTLPESC